MYNAQVSTNEATDDDLWLLTVLLLNLDSIPWVLPAFVLVVIWAEATLIHLNHRVIVEQEGVNP